MPELAGWFATTAAGVDVGTVTFVTFDVPAVQSLPLWQVAVGGVMDDSVPPPFVSSAPSVSVLGQAFGVELVSQVNAPA
jgi:hypothetical protein